MPTIQKTTNYKQFKRFSCNRGVFGNYLIEAIRKKNLLKSRPILVNKDLYVIDGQHRLFAAEILNVPIYYVVDDSLQEEDIAILNANQKAWAPHNYLQFYTDRGFADYTFIGNIVRETGLPLHFIISCADAGKNCYKKFNDGLLEIVNKSAFFEKIQKFAELHEACREICGYKMYISNAAMRVLWNFMQHENYVHSEFLDKCKKFPDKVVYCFNFRLATNIKKEIVEIFNYKRSGCNRISFD